MKNSTGVKVGSWHLPERVGTLIADIREQTQLSIVGMKLPSPGNDPGPYSQPDLEFQVKAVTELLKAVKIELANAPVMLVDGYEQPIVMQSRRLTETEMVTLPDGCDTMFIYNWFTMDDLMIIYNWFTMDDLMTRTKFQMIRLAFAGEGKQLT